MITGNELNFTELIDNIKSEYGFTWEEMASYIIENGNTDNDKISKNHLMKWRNGTKPKHENLKAIATAFNLSENFVFSLCDETGIDYTKIGNTEISQVTGLSDQAINALRNIKKSDDNAIRNEQPGLCVLPVLNDMLSVYGGTQFEQLLQAFRDYINTDYCVPVYHTDKSIVRDSKEYGNILDTETITSSSDLDIIKGQPPVYLQYFAKENDLYDNKPIAITKEFLQAVALKQLEQALMELRKDIIENK